MGKTNKVVGRIEEGQLLNAKVNGFDYQVDYPRENYEPIASNPGGVLTLALAGCKAVIAKQYCDARNIDVVLDVEVVTAIENIDGRDQAEFTVDLKFTGDIEEKDLDKLEKVLDQECTVEHLILSDKNKIKTNYRLEPKAIS